MAQENLSGDGDEVGGAACLSPIRTVEASIAVPEDPPREERNGLKSMILAHMV